MQARKPEQRKPENGSEQPTNSPEKIDFQRFRAILQPHQRKPARTSPPARTILRASPYQRVSASESRKLFRKIFQKSKVVSKVESRKPSRKSEGFQSRKQSRKSFRVGSIREGVSVSDIFCGIVGFGIVRCDHHILLVLIPEIVLAEEDTGHRIDLAVLHIILPQVP